jgi:DNA polymerase-3 subunit delta'
MNPSAANALLKTVEEPAGQTLMLLISAHPSRLPATIRSRCQRVAFSPPPRDTALAWLSARGVDADPDLLYGLSAGSPLKALALADPGILAERHCMLEELFDLLAGHRDPVAVAERWHKLDLNRTLEWLAGWAVDMVRLRTMPSPPMLFNPDQAERLRRAGADVPSRRLHAIVQRTLRPAGSAAGQLNAHLLLEGLLLEWVAGAGATPARRSPGKPDRP